MSITVTKQGWQHHSGTWNSVSGTYIGREDYSHFDMTEFIVTPDKTYSSVTLTFAGSGVTGLAAKWGRSKPDDAWTGGTAITTGSSNSITVTGTFTAGQSFSIFVWSSINTYQTTTVGSASATGVEPTPVEDDGVARVRSGGNWGKYEVKLRHNGSWGSYEPYVRYNGQWRKMV